jgi:hypothetical protein
MHFRACAYCTLRECGLAGSSLGVQVVPKIPRGAAGIFGEVFFASRSTF